jgi:hypothetical protein
MFNYSIDNLEIANLYIGKFLNLNYLIAPKLSKFIYFDAKLSHITIKGL